MNRPPNPHPSFSRSPATRGKHLGFGEGVTATLAKIATDPKLISEVAVKLRNLVLIRKGEDAPNIIWLNEANQIIAMITKEVAGN